MSLREIGPWAYIIGVVIALIAGFFAQGNPTLALVIGLLGIIVGLLNVTDKEVSLFLVASIALIVAGSSLSKLMVELGAKMLPGLFNGLSGALNYLVVFTAPAAAVISIIALYKLSRD